MDSLVVYRYFFAVFVFALGACVGGFTALIIRNYFAARGLGFAAAADGTVHALPGPSWRRIRSIAARRFGSAS